MIGRKARRPVGHSNLPSPSSPRSSPRGQLSSNNDSSNDSNSSSGSSRSRSSLDTKVTTRNCNSAIHSLPVMTKTVVSATAAAATSRKETETVARDLLAAVPLAEKQQQLAPTCPQPGISSSINYSTMASQALSASDSASASVIASPTKPLAQHPTSSSPRKDTCTISDTNKGSIGHIHTHNQNSESTTPSQSPILSPRQSHRIHVEYDVRTGIIVAPRNNNGAATTTTGREEGEGGRQRKQQKKLNKRLGQMQARIRVSSEQSNNTGFNVVLGDQFWNHQEQVEQKLKGEQKQGGGEGDLDGRSGGSSRGGGGEGGEAGGCCYDILGRKILDRTIRPPPPTWPPHSPSHAHSPGRSPHTNSHSHFASLSQANAHSQPQYSPTRSSIVV